LRPNITSKKVSNNAKAVTVRQACEISNLGVTTIYKLIGDGRLESVMLDGRRLINRESLHKLIGC
jgi:excisionase family DNA binding protein